MLDFNWRVRVVADEHKSIVTTQCRFISPQYEHRDFLRIPFLLSNVEFSGVQVSVKQHVSADCKQTRYERHDCEYNFRGLLHFAKSVTAVILLYFADSQRE